MDVSKALDERSPAVVGGRNSAVGVGDLPLEGEHSLDIYVVSFLLYFIIEAGVDSN